MKNYFKFLYQQLLLIIVFIIVGAGISIMPAYFNINYEYYEITFKCDKDVDVSSIKSKDYLEKVKADIEKIRDDSRYIFVGDKKEVVGLVDVEKTDTGVNINGKIIDGFWDQKYYYSYSSFEYVNISDLSKSIRLKQNENDVVIKCSAEEFNTWQQARRFLKRMVTNLELDDTLFKLNDNYVSDDTSKDLNSSIITHAFINVYPYMLIGVFCGLSLSLLVLLIIYLIKKDSVINKLEFDNNEIFRTPFSINYWKKAFSVFKDVKNIAMISILLAMMLVCKMIPLPSGFGNMGLSPGFIFYSLACAIYGPIAGLLMGCLSDTFGFFLFPSGSPFHLGYTLNAMIPGLVYGLLLYRTKITGTKCFVARIIVNLFVNAILGSIWWGQVSNFNSDQTLTYFLTLSLPKNIVFLIPQSIVLFSVLKIVSRVLKASNLVPEEICNNITLI